MVIEVNYILKSKKSKEREQKENLFEWERKSNHVKCKKNTRDNNIKITSFLIIRFTLLFVMKRRKKAIHLFFSSWLTFVLIMWNSTLKWWRFLSTIVSFKWNTINWKKGNVTGKKRPERRTIAQWLCVYS